MVESIPMVTGDRETIRARAAKTAAFAVALGLAALFASGRPADDARTADPLASEIARWSSYLATHSADAKDENWAQVKAAATPVMEAAEKALADGRRLLALQRLAAVRTMLSATVYVAEHTGPESKDEAAFEAEWQRMGRELRPELSGVAGGAFDGVRPAAVRAMAEAAMPQIRGYYDASLEFGRSTEPDSGLFYLGSARAQREFAALCRSLSLPGGGAPPKLRPLAHELHDLEARLLAAYRPPASIDRHSEFIVTNSTLNEARELDAAGLRYGALARYLQAALRAAPLLPPPAADPAPLAQRLRDLEARLSSEEIDHSIGRIFLESAQADLPAKPANAEAIAADVLPRYFAALRPAPPRPIPPAPAVTVTLVRWPYT